MKELFLTLLPLAQELDIVDDQRIDGAKLTVKAGNVALFDGANEPVDEILATEQLNDCPV